MSENLPGPSLDSFAQPPDEAPTCIANLECGYFNTCAATSTMVERFPHKWGGADAARRLQEKLGQAQTAILVAAEGCPGSDDSTSWQACPRRGLAQGMLDTARALAQQDDSHFPGQYM